MFTTADVLVALCLLSQCLRSHMLITVSTVSVLICSLKSYVHYSQCVSGPRFMTVNILLSRPMSITVDVAVVLCLPHLMS